MFNITNRTNGCVQIVVKSFSKKRKNTKEISTLNIPARQKISLPDERIIDEYLNRYKKWGLISFEYVNEKDLAK